MSVLAVIEHDRGSLTSASLGVLTAGRALAKQMGTQLEAVPFDAGRNVIPHVDGRVQRDGAPEIGRAHV